MEVVHTIAGLRESLGKAALPLGLVPTMGALHEGHLTLVRRARSENATVAVSIFVNPSQFGPQEGFASYPRDINRDLAALEKEGVHLVFIPFVEEMYPAGFDTWVEVGALTRRLEGEFRPGHFRGVATVVAKLFDIVRPNRAYFGQKDAQQVLVVKRLNADLNLDVEIVLVPTVREADGLAMSSRNVHLAPEERQAATVLYRSLCLARHMYEEGSRNAEAVRRAMQGLLEQESLVSIDYISIADADTLEELDLIDRPALVSLAVRIGKTRLIDNMVLPHSAWV